MIADFGSYCYDGEPPTESIAAVGTGSLAEWSVNVTKDFDGWERATVSDDGQQVVFDRDTTLRWSRADGFVSTGSHLVLTRGQPDTAEVELRSA